MTGGEEGMGTGSADVVADPTFGSAALTALPTMLCKDGDAAEVPGSLW